MNNPLLTEQEKAVLALLAEAWNVYVSELPILHSWDNVEFMHAIHAAQNIVLTRPTVRAEGLERITQANQVSACDHVFFSCQVPAGDSCVPIYHQVCKLCRWDETKGVIMPNEIWEGYAIRQLNVGTESRIGSEG